MAIKISGSTIIDDSRGIVNAGISTFNNDVTLTGKVIMRHGINLIIH